MSRKDRKIVSSLNPGCGKFRPPILSQIKARLFGKSGLKFVSVKWVSAWFKSEHSSFTAWFALGVVFL